MDLRQLKILFISADLGLYRDNIIDSRYHFGLAHLISFMKERGHDTRYCYFHDYQQMERLVSFVDDYHPDIIACTVIESQWPHIQRITEEIKKRTSVPLVCGGAFPSLCPEEVCCCPSIDAVLVGEGERAFAELIHLLYSGKEWRGAPNLVLYDPEKKVIQKNKILPLVENLDLLPFPDRTFHRDPIFYDSFVKDESSRVGFDIAFTFSRGCPFNCTYCCCSTLSRKYSHGVRLPRFRSPGNCLEEIGQVLETHNLVKPVMFFDDVFTAHKEWLFPFLDGYRKRFKKKFSCRTRVEVVDESIFKALKSAGCYNIAMSVESGNDYIRNTIMKRPCSKNDIITAFRMAHKHGITTGAPSIIGVPFETRETIKETIATIAQTNSIRCYVGIFYPYKGTALYETCKTQGLLSERTFDGRRRAEPVLKLPDVTQQEIQNYYDTWEKRVIAQRPVMRRIAFYTQRYGQTVYYFFVRQVRRYLLLLLRLNTGKKSM